MCPFNTGYYLLEVTVWVALTVRSNTCIKRSPLGQRKSGLIRQVTSLERFDSYEFFMSGQDVQVTAWAGLTVILFKSVLPLKMRVGELGYQLV